MNTHKTLEEWFNNNKSNQITVEQIIPDKLQAYYSQQSLNDINIPHYSNWSKDNYGLMIKFFKPLDDEEYIPFAWTSTQPEEAIDFYKRKNAQDVYGEKLRNLGNGNLYDNYYRLLQHFICESIDFELYDIVIASRIAKKREKNETFKIYSDGYSIMDENGQYSFLYEGDNKFHHGNEELGCTDIQLATFAQARIDDDSITIPYNFQYCVNEQNELLLEKNYKEIQKELLYNDKLRNYFKRYPQKDNRAYYYKEACSRIGMMCPNFDTYNCKLEEEYIYIIESLTGINLAFHYTKYYTQIKKFLSSQMPEEKISALLLWVLDEFIDMPIVFTRNQLLKEFMEPIIFFNTEIETGLVCAKKILSNINKKNITTWNELFELMHTPKIFETTKKIKCNIEQQIQDNRDNKYPFLFIEKDIMVDVNQEDFATVFQHIITKKTFNYNIN